MPPYLDVEHVLNETVNGKVYNITFKINIEKYAIVFESKHILILELKDKSEEVVNKIDALKQELNSFAIDIAERLSKFRVNLFGSVIKKMLSEIADKRIPNPITVKLNSDNVIHLIPSSDKVTLIYGINFTHKTDKSLARVFLLELEDSKRHVKNSIEAQYFPDVNKPPAEVLKVEQDCKRYSNGFLVFSKRIKFI
jgi:hypothetical protein